MFLARLPPVRPPFKKQYRVLAEEDIREPEARSARFPSITTPRMERFARLGMRSYVCPNGKSHSQSSFGERQAAAELGLSGQFFANSQGFLCCRVSVGNKLFRQRVFLEDSVDSLCE